MIVVEPLGRVLRLCAGAVFTALLVFAPLNYGSTREDGADLVALTAALATLLWAASLPFAGRSARVPVFAACALAFFVIAAVPWIGGFAHATSLSAFTETHFTNVSARWPVSIVWRDSLNTVLLSLALAGSALALVDLSRDRGWALTFSVTLVGVAVVVASLAMLQVATGARGIYWLDHGRLPGNFSGVFYHHTSAGAYLNTAWPLAVALTVWATRRERFGLSRALMVAGSLIIILLLAAHGSHVSRFPQVAALVAVPFLLMGLQIPLRPGRVHGVRPWLLLGGGVAALLLLVAVTGRTESIGARWRMLFGSSADSLSIVQTIHPPEATWPALIRDDLLIPHTSQPGMFGDRGEGWRTALRAIAARPWVGHGPGNWMGAANQHSSDPFVRTFYQFLQFAHQDTLQTAVEWGIPAALGWWGFLVGALVAVFRARRWISPTHRSLSIGAACALGALLLQAQIDFPLEMPAIAFNAFLLAALCWAGVDGRASDPISPSSLTT